MGGMKRMKVEKDNKSISDSVTQRRRYSECVKAENVAWEGLKMEEIREMNDKNKLLTWEKVFRIFQQLITMRR